MGVEGQFTESFAGWSHEVRRGEALVLDSESRSPIRLPSASVPNIVKYRLLPTTAVVAIALAAPSFSSDAGTLLEQPGGGLNNTATIAPSDQLGEIELSAFAIEEQLAIVPGDRAGLLVAPLISEPVVQATVPSELISVPQGQTQAPVADTATSGVTFAETFEPFEVTPANVEAVAAATTISAPKSVSAASPISPEVSPEEPALAVVTVSAPVAQSAVSAVQLIAPSAPSTDLAELPISALGQGSITQPVLASISIEPVTVPIVAIAPPAALSDNPSLTADDTRSLALQSNSVEPAVASAELVIRRGPVRKALVEAPVAAKPQIAPTVPAPTRNAAITPQLTALPPGRGGPARNDAMPIEVAKPQAVPTPAAKTSVSSAQPVGFANVVDPRRPASQPVSGTVSGFDLKIQSQLITRIDGRVAGQLEFQQTNKALAVRLGSVVELLKDRYNMSEFERITASSAADVFVTMAQLRDAGIPITYDPVYDEFNVGSREHRPTNAHKVQIDQIGSPSRSTKRSAMDQARP